MLLLLALAATLQDPADEPIECPPSLKTAWVHAGVICLDDVRAREKEEADRKEVLRRGHAFKDRAPPPALRDQIRRKMDREILIDGVSARYQFPLWRHPEFYCFTVNAKNQFGAYTGWSEFVVALGPGGKVVEIANSLEADFDCEILK